MKAPEHLSPLQQLTTEVHNLLAAYWFFKKRSKESVTKNPGGIDALEDMILLQSLTQDIVLRLGKLGDTRRDTLSFMQVVKHIRKHGPVQNIPANIDSKIAQFEKEIEDIKVHHRNSYMAHISKSKPWPFKPSFNLREAIQLAIQICDDLHGEKMEYKISSDWAGIEIDLRMQL